MAVILKGKAGENKGSSLLEKEDNMEYLCPLCNGLEKIGVECPRCGEPMEDKGCVQEYLDDYSPYLDMEITRKVDGAPPDQCLHVFSCSNCSHTKMVAVSMVEY